MSLGGKGATTRLVGKKVFSALTGSVAGDGVAAARAAVLHTRQGRETLGEDRVLRVVLSEMGLAVRMQTHRYHITHTVVLFYFSFYSLISIDNETNTTSISLYGIINITKNRISAHLRS